MNIEGAERPSIRGMIEALNRTETLCASCHDFLADRTGDDRLRTKGTVAQFLREAGGRVVEQSGPALPGYLCDQLFAYNPACSRLAECSQTLLEAFGIAIVKECFHFQVCPLPNRNGPNQQAVPFSR